MEIEDLIKDINVTTEENGEASIKVEFKDNQSPEEADCIKAFLLELYEKQIKGR